MRILIERSGWLSLSFILAFSLAFTPGALGAQEASKGPKRQGDRQEQKQGQTQATATNVTPKPSTAPSPLPKAEEAPLPKPGPRGPAEPAKLSLPPFMGFFGSPELLKETGFRSSIGKWIEYEISQPGSGGATAGTLLVQQVGPSVRGGRWLEFVVSQGGSEAGGFRMLTRGEGADNIERIVILASGLPPIEVPVDSATLSFIAPEAPGAKDPSKVAELGELRLEGKEEIETPLGVFDTERWVIAAGDRQVVFWITRDSSIPFSGLVKLRRSDGEFHAVATGDEAKARILVPARLH